MSNPVDEYLLSKVAFLGLTPAMEGHLRDAATSTAVQLGVATALMAAPAAASKLLNAVTKQHSYNQMLRQNPELAGLREDSPEQFNNFYNSMYRLNPTFAQDPVVAGAYMNKMLANPSTAGFAVVESLNRSSSSMPTLGDAWRAGAQTGTKAFTRGYEQATSPVSEDPLAEQEQRVRALGLKAKERELQGRLGAGSP